MWCRTNRWVSTATVTPYRERCDAGWQANCHRCLRSGSPPVTKPLATVTFQARGVQSHAARSRTERSKIQRPGATAEGRGRRTEAIHNAAAESDSGKAAVRKNTRTCRDAARHGKQRKAWPGRYEISGCRKQRHVPAGYAEGSVEQRLR